MGQRISVIIPAHQEEYQIGETLESLVTQTYRNFEAVVVANACTDRTAENARNYKSKMPLTVLETEKGGIGYASNTGFYRASGNVIVTLDADTTLSSNALEEIENVVNQGFIGGTLRMEAKEDRFRYRLLCLLHQLSRGGNWNGMRFCRGDVYKRIGGYTEDPALEFISDAYFKREVKKLGRTKLVRDASFKTSMRRFERLGLREFLQQTLGYLSFNVTGKELVKRKYPAVR